MGNVAKPYSALLRNLLLLKQRSSSRSGFAQVETRIDAIRKRVRGEGLPLTRKEALGLAGEWYRWFVGKHQEYAENNELAEAGWSVQQNDFFDDLEELAPLWFREKSGRTDDDWLHSGSTSHLSD
jgi:hypothetical protein